jgi:2-polyprenyl-3-methyl-5-hydroxy-6-metoxy-1,4-benzoquinol methylase
MSDPTRGAFKPELYDAIPPGYYDDVHAAGRGVQWFWHRHRFGAVDEWLPPHGSTILDMGCGPGTFLGNYASGFERGLGIDIAGPQIAIARQRYGGGRLSFEARRAEEYAGELTFDAVVSIEVIEHIPPEQTQTFLRLVHGLLNPGGTLVLTTPNYRSLWPLLEWIISRKGPVDYLEQHINRFDTRRLVREVEAAGFVVEKHRTFFVAAPFLAVLSTTLAERVYSWERRFLPRAGSELILAARKR